MEGTVCGVAAANVYLCNDFPEENHNIFMV